MTIAIERLRAPLAPDDLEALAELLCDAVNSGSAVSFLAPLAQETAKAWWRKTIDGADPKTIFLVARNAGERGAVVIGTVQLHASWAPNQPHRADIAKLIVHRRARGKGVGRLLMQAVEQAAAEVGYSLLVLDTRRGCEAEGLYRKLGWTEAGVIPDFALNADGSGLHDTVIFYKALGRGGSG
jgi:acetyltransferase